VSDYKTATICSQIKSNKQVTRQPFFITLTKFLFHKDTIIFEKTIADFNSWVHFKYFRTFTASQTIYNGTQTNRPMRLFCR